MQVVQLRIFSILLALLLLVKTVRKVRVDTAW